MWLPRMRDSVSAVYRNQIDDIITNVTLSSTPQLIVRQRQNAAEALTRGVDAQADYRWRSWRVDLGYLYSESRFATGERIPQVPKHSGNAQLTYSKPNTLVSFGLALVSPCSSKMIETSSFFRATPLFSSLRGSDYAGRCGQAPR